MPSRCRDLFPFRSPRPGQRDFLQDARDCARSGEVLIAHAPTGLGKTAVALSAMLEAGLDDDGRVIFLTPRQSQHRAVVETVKSMSCDAGLVDLLSRESMCPFTGEPPCLSGRRCGLSVEPLMRRCADRALSEPMHAQEMISMCLREGACPYLSARMALDRADIVVGDFSRAFGDLPDVLHLDRPRRPQYLVVDEAHNLPERVMASFSREIIAPFPADGLEEVWTDMLGRGRRIIHKDEMRSLMDRHCLPEPEDLEGRSDFLDAWLRLGDACVRIAYPEQERIAIRFMEPGLVVRSVTAKCAAALFMSGTLHPPEFFASRLGLEDAICRSYPSPFDPERRLVMVVPEVGTRFRDRGSENVAMMASRIAQLSAEAPGNVLAFLPSYAYLSAVYRQLKDRCWNKELVAERPGLGKEEKDALAARLMGGQRTLMLCNISGSFAEGVDFPRGCLSMVIVAGLPVPPPSLERNEMDRRARISKGRGTWSQRMDVQEAVMKVMQACGRAIRREEDRAAVVLMDPRYLEPCVRRLLPPDLSYAQGEPLALLRGFFRPAGEVWTYQGEGERIITGH